MDKTYHLFLRLFRLLLLSELSVNQLLTVDQAIAILDAVPLQPRVVSVPLDRALGWRLAEDIFADSDYPPFDKAVMDGFAVRSEDCQLVAESLGVRLSVIGSIAAGAGDSVTIGPGQAAAIMTGAPLPAGADAVIPVEKTSRDGNLVLLHDSVKAGQSIARRGSDTASGRLLLVKGNVLRPAQIGVAATVGKSTIAIYDPPSVAIIATGDELVEIDQTPTGSQIRNSNLHMLSALLKRMGCGIRSQSVVRDNPDAIREAIQAGIKCDALFVTGGMSMGEHDHVPRLLNELGLTLQVSKLRIKPGKPFVFATKQRQDSGRNPAIVFGLPGNPVSAFVCTLRLASRVLDRLGGRPFGCQVVTRKLLTAIAANGPRETYLLARRASGGVEILNSSGSADLFTLALADCLVIRGENADRALTGDMVRVINVP